MNFIKKSIITKKRRAVSQVIGALFALAIVATFGSVLLIQGVQGVENFTSFLNIFEETDAKSAQEVFIVEHVRFNPIGEDIEVWVRNTGKIDIIIDKISIVKVNTQELIFSKESINQNLFQKNYTRIALSSSDVVTFPSVSPATWQGVYNSEGSGEYRITVTTIRDKSVESVAGLFNS
jgi:hypothetical protein